MPKMQSVITLNWDAADYAAIAAFDANVRRAVEAMSDELGVEMDYKLSLRRKGEASTLASVHPQRGLPQAHAEEPDESRVRERVEAAPERSLRRGDDRDDRAYDRRDDRDNRRGEWRRDEEGERGGRDER